MKTRNQFVTKKDLNNALKDTESRLNIRIDRVIKLLNFYIEPIKETNKKWEKFMDSTTKTLDWLVGKFTKFDDELTILNSRYPEINDKLEDHEKRITSLENISTPN